MKAIRSYLIREGELKPCLDFNLWGVPVCGRAASSAHPLHAPRCWSGPYLRYLNVLGVFKAAARPDKVSSSQQHFGEQPLVKIPPWQAKQAAKLGLAARATRVGTLSSSPSRAAKRWLQHGLLLPRAGSDPCRSQPGRALVRPQGHRGCSWPWAAA